MGGSIADQVRRALIAAAKVAPVAVAIDAAGCDGREEPRALCPYVAPDSGGFGGGGASTGGARFSSGGSGGGGRPSDSGTDVQPKEDSAVTGASKDGG